MNKKLSFFAVLLFVVSASFAQQNDKSLYETAKKFMREGDYDNATLVFNKVLEQEPNNVEALKDFAFLNYLKREYAKSIEIGKLLIEKPDADVQSFQILGMAYKGIAEYKECRKLYKRALTKFPNSGVIHNEYGELLGLDNDLNAAIVEWEDGIKADANYSGNYYNASMYYAKTNNLFWAMIYGEMFVNLESYTQRSAAIKGMLLDVYKQFYSTMDFAKLAGDKKAAPFQKSFYETLAKSASLSVQGITPENLIAIRTRFILDWFYNKNNEKFPFKLFDQEQYFLREGMFEAYSQWIFGAADSPSAYQMWIDTHDKAAAGYKEFQQGRVFKIPAGQYYQIR
jgi:Tfp pilus assembly protein PilF